jgi:membrane protease subunit HflC
MVGREEILAGMLDKARASTPEYGIDLLDVQIKRINYVEQVRRSVYERMINERKKVATQYRSEGEGEKADILGQMERELKEIRSEAQRQSLEISGRGDAEATAIYARAYNQDKEFYAFLRTLGSYEKALQGNGRLVISTDSDFYKYLKKAR